MHTLKDLDRKHHENIVENIMFIFLDVLRRQVVLKRKEMSADMNIFSTTLSSRKILGLNSRGNGPIHKPTSLVSHNSLSSLVSCPKERIFYRNKH